MTWHTRLRACVAAMRQDANLKFHASSLTKATWGTIVPVFWHLSFCRFCASSQSWSYPRQLCTGPPPVFRDGRLFSSNAFSTHAGSVAPRMHSAAFAGKGRKAIDVPNVTFAVLRALAIHSTCVPDQAVMLSMATTHHAKLRQVQFARVSHMPCFMSRVVSVCYGFTDKYGECVVGDCNRTLGLANPCLPSDYRRSQVIDARPHRLGGLLTTCARARARPSPPCVACARPLSSDRVRCLLLVCAVRRAQLGQVATLHRHTACRQDRPVARGRRGHSHQPMGAAAVRGRAIRLRARCAHARAHTATHRSASRRYTP